MQLKPLSTSEGGLIVDSRDLGVNALKDIATFSEEYKAQIRDFQKQNGVGDTIADFLSYAKSQQVQVFEVPYMDLLQHPAASDSSCRADKLSWRKRYRARQVPKRKNEDLPHAVTRLSD
jgi:hypothetical protein